MILYLAGYKSRKTLALEDIYTFVFLSPFFFVRVYVVVVSFFLVLFLYGRGSCFKNPDQYLTDYTRESKIY